MMEAAIFIPPPPKRPSMEWHYAASPKKQKARTISQLDKLWEQTSGSPRKKTVSAVHYVAIL
jgi:hypothetical protein